MGKRNTNVVDEEVTAEKGDRSWHSDGEVTYSHPSYGMIKVSHFSGGKGELFGSEIKSSGGVCFTISEAQVTQSLSTNWYFDKEVITEVEMTSVQYAELISKPNCQGQPCTIRHRSDMGRIVYKGIDTKVQYAESEVNDKLETLKSTVKSLTREHSAILNQKGALKKADKEAATKLVERIDQILNGGMDFYLKSVREALDYAKVEAKADIEASAAAMINRLGTEVLTNPEALKLLEIGHER